MHRRGDRASLNELNGRGTDKRKPQGVVDKHITCTDAFCPTVALVDEYNCDEALNRNGMVAYYGPPLLLKLCCWRKMKGCNEALAFLGVQSTE